MTFMGRANEWDEAYGSGFGSAGAAQLINVPVELLDPWKDADGKDQPFHSYSEEQLNDLTENIRQHGIITPLRVRPMGRRFQILAGHNRCAAAKRLGLRTVPTLVQQVDDDEAIGILVDSNLQQRQTLLPSEKAWAYRLKLEAMKRQGQRSDLTCGQTVHKSEDRSTCGQFVHKSRDDISDTESGRQINRYIRLTYLLPALLELVDRKKLSFGVGIDLSFLPKNTQSILFRLITEEQIKISGKLAKRLHETMPESETEIREILAIAPKLPEYSFTVALPSELSTEQFQQLSKNRAFRLAAATAMAELVRIYLPQTRSKGINTL